MLTSAHNFSWSNRHTAAALAVGASASAIYAAYRLYRYHGYFSRAGIRPVSEGDLTFEVKRAVDEYLQFHYATAQEVLPYPRAPKVQRANSRSTITAVVAKLLVASCRRHCNF